MSALRTVHVVGGTMTGCTRVVLNLVERHDRARVDPALCFFSVVPPDRETLDEAARLAVPFENVVKRSRYDATAIPRLALALRRLRPDVVMAHGFGTYTFASLAARASGARAMVRVEHSPELYTRLHRVASAATARLASSTVAVSRYLADYLGAQGTRAPRLEVIPNGIDLAPFDAVRRAPFEASDPPVVLMAARLDVAKDHATLLAAAARLHARGVRFRLDLAGSGPFAERLAARARALGLDGVVRFLGFRRDVARLVEDADLAVLATHYEGFGLAVVEAMAGGRPVVASAVGAVPELFEHGAHGLLVPPRDPEALADALAGLLADPARARAMGEAARRHARARYALDGAVRAFEAHLARVAR